MRILDGLKNLGSRVAAEAGKVEKAVEHAVQPLEQEAQKLAGAVEADAFVLAKNLPKLVNLLPGAPQDPDLKYDGMLVGASGQAFPPSTPLSQIPAVTPQGGVRNDETILFVNGAGQNKAGEVNYLHAAANATGSRVIGIHNATDGWPVDAIQCVEDMMNVGDDKAVDTIASTVYSQIEAGHPVHIMAHSMGAAETARALAEVNQRLLAQGLTPAQAQAKLHLVKVETFGGAGFHYVDGPEYVHYVNRADPVPSAVGLGWDNDPRHAWAGKGAVIREFTDAPKLDILSPHDFATVYLDHWKPFDQVYPGAK